jgi:hypothetical protein
MGIIIIPNQVIRFQNSALINEDCDCLGRGFSQLINKNDDTQFQISSSNDIENGNFESNIDGWDVYTAVTGTALVVNESDEDECDGEVTITASGGTAPYTYSLDGTTFQVSNIFTGLCDGDYVIVIKDSLNHFGSVEFTIFQNVTCGDYEGFTLQQMIDSEIKLGQLYNCILNDIKP